MQKSYFTISIKFDTYANIAFPNINPGIFLFFSAFYSIIFLY